jgi:hypothetical protein
VDSLDYEENLLHTLAWYRRAFLYYYHWLDTGDSHAFRTWSEASATFRKAKREHVSAYEKNLDFPAYNFYAADAGMAHALRSRSMAWLARVVLILTAGLFLAGSRFFQDRSPSWPGKKGVKAIWYNLTRPWGPFHPKERSRADLILLYLVPYSLIAMGLVIFSSFLSPHFAIGMGLSLCVFVVSLRALCRGNPGAGVSLQASVAGSVLCLSALFMAVVSVRGPLCFWYLCWASPSFRISFLSLCVGAFLWMFFVLYAVFRKTCNATGLCAIGNLLMVFGAVLGFNAVVIGAIGLEVFLTALNNELAVLPLSLSKVLGITTHFNINPSLPTHGVVCGAVLACGGCLLRRFGNHGGLLE